MARTSPSRRKSRFAADGSQFQFSVCAPPLLVAGENTIARAAINAERSTPAGSVVEPLSAATASPVTEAVSVLPVSVSITVRVPPISGRSCACASAASANIVSVVAPVITGAWLAPWIVIVTVLDADPSWLSSVNVS